MNERRRFQIALGGVASTVVIAGLFVWSAPPVEYPAVRAPQPFVRGVDAAADHPTFLLERFGVPQPVEAVRYPRGRAPRPIRPDGASGELAVLGPTSAPAAEPAAGAVPLPTRGPRIVLARAPSARGARVAMSLGDSESATHDVRDRGPLTGALATAGREVGRSFRTAGRAIKAIF
jgi:hypothetical protein